MGRDPVAGEVLWLGRDASSVQFGRAVTVRVKRRLDWPASAAGGVCVGCWAAVGGRTGAGPGWGWVVRIRAGQWGWAAGRFGRGGGGGTGVEVGDCAGAVSGCGGGR